MSLVSIATAPAPERPRLARRRGRMARPGVSLLAQGEPMIWLTGGALATCVSMIVALLLLVGWCSVPTFWPVPVVQLTLRDGQVVMGEVTRTERYRLTPEMLASLSGPEADAARALLGNRPYVPATRRLVRTGNFELSGEHFRWVNDFALSPGEESLPKWAVVVERVEWGRFYGAPREFRTRHPRPIGGEERGQAALLQFVEAQRWRVPAEKIEAFNQALAPLQEQLQESRRAGIAAFLKPFAERGEKCLIVLDDGQTVPIREYQAPANVVAVQQLWEGEESVWGEFQTQYSEARRRADQRKDLVQHGIGRINDRLERARLAVRQRELEHQVAALSLATDVYTQETTFEGIQATARDAATALEQARTLRVGAPLLDWVSQFAAAQQKEVAEQLAEPARLREELQQKLRQLPDSVRMTVEKLLAVQRESQQSIAAIQERTTALTDENNRYDLRLVTAGGQDKSLNLADITRAYPANHLSSPQKWGIYADRWWEYLTEEPREANSEGGVWPAIWGTVVMTVVMSMLVVPFGVLAALYLREYARAGWIVSAIRIAISNLAGVPSIVFGVFGLGFFCYLLGSYLDGGAINAGWRPLPLRLWWLCAGGMGVCGLAAFSIGLVLLAGRHAESSRWRRWAGYGSLALWLASFALAIVVLFANPLFEGFFATSLPNPTLGKGGLIWAALTLSLLTLPVVIVATEEALSAVPNSLREGSYACGASKWQTIRRIVLPHALPGIMTGMILAMARGAGEVAPLMLVGAVKLQPELPIDTQFPFVHLSRSFMHLGFHIFDLGFQSQNSEAARPMVFTTTLLLIVIITLLNLTAVWIRSRLRRRLHTGHF